MTRSGFNFFSISSDTAVRTPTSEDTSASQLLNDSSFLLFPLLLNVLDFRLNEVLNFFRIDILASLLD